jgi:hypothetical protein
MTYRLENIDLLHGTVEDGAVLIQVLLDDVVARCAPFADGFHLEFHLRWVSKSTLWSDCTPPNITHLFA